MLANKQREQLSELITDTYGTTEGLIKHLDLAIEMLFYIEEDSFERADIQNVVAAIKGVIGVLREGGDFRK